MRTAWRGGSYRSRLARDQRDPPVAVHLHPAPAGAQPRQLGAAADEHGFIERVRPGGGGTGCGWPRRRSSISARVSRDGAMPSCARRRSANWRPADSAALAVGGEPLDHSAVRCFGQRVECDLGARQPNRLRWIGAGPQPPRARRRAGARARRGPRSPTLRRSRQGSVRRTPRAPGCIAVVKRPLELPHVDSEIRALERDRVPRRDQVPSRGAERLAQLGQSDPQARARRLVEHVRPKARREAALGLRSRVQREIGEHRARPPRRGQRDPRAVHAQLKITR